MLVSSIQLLYIILMTGLFQKDVSKKYSDTGLRVFVTLGPTLTLRDRSHAPGPGHGEYISSGYAKLDPSWHLVY